MSLQALELPAAGFIVAAMIAAACRQARLLTATGAVAAAIVGGTVFAAGGWPAAAALLAFFFSSSLLGRWRRIVKEQLEFEKGGRRDAGQVLANGGVAAAAIALAAIFPSHRAALTVAFLAALAEANADTWATEIGAASGAKPRLITTLHTVEPGRSGGVSLPGSAAALAGSAFIALFALLSPGLRDHAARSISIIALSGFAGSLIDSVLGATVQAQYSSQDEPEKLIERPALGSRLARGFPLIDNDVVNMLANLAAALLALAARSYI